MKTIALVGGGVRSGKSTFALKLARERGARRVFVATGVVTDEGMRDRVVRHRSDRAADFETVEAPVALSPALGAIEADVVVVDCVTFWLSNMLVRGHAHDAILAEVDELGRVLRAAPFSSVLVTNEVGMSVHPETALGRAFQDLVGFAHQRLARTADEVYVAVLGSILRIHPSPVACIR